MRSFVARYGANPLHLLALLASFALAGYAAQFLLASRTIKVGVWFVGAAVGHDVILLPLYAIADLSLTRVWRRSSDDAESQPVPWLNYVRFPVAISLLLLLVFFPEISRRQTVLTSVSRLTTHPYLANWLLVTGSLFIVSAVSYAVRLRLAGRRP